MSFAEAWLFLEQLVPQVEGLVNQPAVVTVQSLLVLSLETPCQTAAALFAKARSCRYPCLTGRAGDMQLTAYFDTSTANAAAPL
jgi:hypothetical protein